jgi:hypothetical protein
MQCLTAQQGTAIHYTPFAFIRVWGLSLRCLTFMVSTQESGRKDILFEDFQPFLNTPKRDARDKLIQTVSLLTRSRNMCSSNFGWKVDYQNILFSGFPQSLQRTDRVCTCNITTLFFARLFPKFTDHYPF